MVLEMVKDDRPRGWPARKLCDDVTVWCGCTLSEVVQLGLTLDKKKWRRVILASTSTSSNEWSLWLCPTCTVSCIFWNTMRLLLLPIATVILIQSRTSAIYGTPPYIFPSLWRDRQTVVSFCYLGCTVVSMHFRVVSRGYPKYSVRVRHSEGPP